MFVCLCESVRGVVRSQQRNTESPPLLLSSPSHRSPGGRAGGQACFRKYLPLGGSVAGVSAELVRLLVHLLPLLLGAAAVAAAAAGQRSPPSRC